MNKFLFSLVAIFAIFLTGCSNDNKEEEPELIVSQSALVYAVNGNNLSSDLTRNMLQMKEALKTLPAGQYEMYVFKTNDKESAGLYKAVSGENADFELVKEYKRDVLATDPARIKEVIGDFMNSKGQKRTLFLWGHGMAWTPRFSDHKTSTKSVAGNLVVSEDFPNVEYFGGDNNSTDWTDIDELRDAIPSNVFDTIWFDCCYMGNIETAYELKDKCKWMVAYPTEIAASGLPYDHVLPHILSDKYDLVGAADALFKFYASEKTPITVSVMDMSKIEALADMCRQIYKKGNIRPEENQLQNYSNHKDKFYDLGHYTKEYAQLNGASEMIPRLNKAIEDFMIYTEALERGFSGLIINKENYSGVSTHYFTDSSSEKDTYYRSLEWYKATYGN